MASTIVAGRPVHDYADNWCSLFELFVTVSGLKLRLNIPDTVIIKEGRMLGWFYTNKDGVVCRCALHEISPSTLFQKLVGSATLDEAYNPNGYVALSHFESGVSRPLKQAELQHLLADLVGPYETARPSLDPNADVPFCIQAYIIPMHDKRYLTTYGGAEHPTCTTFARRFSARYTHATDAPPQATQLLAEESGDGAEPPALTAEELVVESQLVAMGLLEPRRAGGAAGQDGAGYLDGEGDEVLGPSSSQLTQHGGVDAMMPASRACKQEMARQIQALVSFVERAHGLRMQGLVTEFVQAHSQVLVLIAVHAVQWDGRASRGRLGTFTERWQDYANGLGPAPAAQPPSKKAHAPGLLMSHDHNSVIMTERSAGLQAGPALLSTSGAAAAPVAGVLSGGAPAPDSWARRSAAAGGRGAAGGAAHPLLAQNSDGSYVTVGRPGSAPANVVQRLRPAHVQGYPGPRNGYSSVRNAVASARRGAGGNPATVGPSVDSYALFASREMLSTDTIAGTLVLEVELLKERLQRQVDIALRAEAALTQLAVTSQGTQAGLIKQLQEARATAEAATQGRAQVEAELERLHTERSSFTQQISALEKEAAAARAALQDDRATLAETVRAAAAKEEGLEDLVNRLRADNEQLTQQVSSLQRRLEEESEVVEAARNQLYDYRQMVGVLQNQLRRGKNKPAGADGGKNPAPGSLTPAALASSLNGFNIPGLVPAGPGTNTRTSAVNQNFDGDDVGSDVGSTRPGTALDMAPLGGPGGPAKSKSVVRRPGNSPLNPAARARALSKSDTAPAQR